MRRAAFLLAGSIGAWACAGERSSPAPDPGELRVAVQGDITGLYPALRNESYSFVVNSNLYEGLTALGHDLGPQPALSDAWENPDEHTWLFHLRPGVRFSDGTPVRAADVVASLRHATAARATGTLLAPVASVDAISEEQVRVRTRFPCPVLLAHLAFAYVLPESALAATALPPTGAPGTGPFVVASWQSGRELLLVANPYFNRKRPDFARVRFVVLSDAGERLGALRSGQADVADNVPPEAIEELRRDTGLSVVSRPSLRVLFLVLRVDVQPFANPLVREALDVALDRAALVARALHGFGTPASQLVPPPVLGFNPAVPVVPVDRARARELLRRAGHPDGFAIELAGPSNRYPSGEALLTEVAGQLGQVGVRVAAVAEPKERFFARVDSDRYEMLLYGWSCETVQAGEALDDLVRTPDVSQGPGVAHFSDPLVDQMIDAANHSSRIEERKVMLADALAAVAAARPYLPLVIQNETFAFRTGRVAWDPSLDMALRIPDVRRAPVPAAR